MAVIVENGELVEVPDDYIAPVIFTPEPGPYRIGKSTPWRRMTNAEAENVATAIQQQSVREQMIYNAASYIDSGDPLYDQLRQLLVALFGEPRADELLAPEEVT